MRMGWVMKKTPEIAVLVTSFERPGHLSRALASIAAQRGVDGGMEVVVTDDGSRDDTAHVVRRFADSVPFPVRFTTHPHADYQVALCRNEGVAASTAPYLLFLDGDCLIPPDHLRIQLQHSREGRAAATYFAWLDRNTSERITESEVKSGRYQQRLGWRQRCHLVWKHLQATYYSVTNDPHRPKFFGGNLGLTRTDYERINGFDENFRGWGCEDDDLRLRMRAAGIKISSITWWTHVCHLWHAKDTTAGAKWRNGANVEYLQRPARLTKCLNGLRKRRLQDLNVQCVGRRPPKDLAERVLPLWCRVALGVQQPRGEQVEIELAFASGGGHFSKGCSCRVLVVPRGTIAPVELVQDATFIFADSDIPGAAGRVFSLNSFDAILQRQLGAVRDSIATQRAALAA
jgi:glycosyltransferase involved in cell wall biosynthesis